MSKFYGNVGFVKYEETSPGVWTESIIERPYYGDISRSYIKNDDSGNVNDNVNISNAVSMVADVYMFSNIDSIAYVTIFESKWKVKNVEIRYPRIILTVNGVYNENESGTA